MSKTYLPKNPEFWHWLDFTGRDAKDFLQRLTTVNLMRLESGQGINGCFLNAQGKFRAFFTLWHTGENAYAFEFEGGIKDHWKELLLSTIDQYTFSEDLKIQELKDEAALWIFPEAGETLSSLGLPEISSGQTVFTSEGLRVSHHGDQDFGRNWITVWGDYKPAGSARTDEVSLDQVESWRIRALRPRVDFEISENVNPLELGMLDAVAPNKGCYPGQEIIEKIAALGSPAKRLALLESAKAFPAAGSLVFSGENEAGQITSVSAVVHAGKFSALALLKKTSAKEGTSLSFAKNSEPETSVLRVSQYA